MLSHLWLKNRSIVSRWKIDYVKLNKHRSLARVQMSLRGRAKAAARGQGPAGSGEQGAFAFLRGGFLLRPQHGGIGGSHVA